MRVSEQGVDAIDFVSAVVRAYAIMPKTDVNQMLIDRMAMNAALSALLQCGAFPSWA